MKARVIRLQIMYGTRRPRSFMDHLLGRLTENTVSTPLAPDEAVPVWHGLEVSSEADVVIDFVTFLLESPGVPASTLGEAGWDAACSARVDHPIDIIAAKHEALRTEARLAPVTGGDHVGIRPCTLPGGFGAMTCAEAAWGERPFVRHGLNLGQLADESAFVMPDSVSMTAYGSAMAVPCLFIAHADGQEVRTDVRTGEPLRGSILPLELGNPATGGCPALTAYGKFRRDAERATGRSVSAVTTFVTWSSTEGFKSPAQAGAPGKLGEWLPPVRVILSRQNVLTSVLA